MTARLPPLQTLHTFAAAARHGNFSRAGAELRAYPHRALTVSVLPAFAVHWLIPRLADFNHRHPDIDINIRASPLLVAFFSEDVDIAVRYGGGQWPGVHAVRARYSRTVLCEMPSSREIVRVGAPAPKCNVISRRIRRMDSLLVGIPHSIDCDGALDASSTMTCETPPPPGRPTHNIGRLRQNGGRHQIRMLDAISSEHLDGLRQNPHAHHGRNHGRAAGTYRACIAARSAGGGDAALSSSIAVAAGFNWNPNANAD